MFLALLCPVLFSVSAVCGHRSARLIGGMEANFWRVSCAFVFLGIWACTFGTRLSGTAFPLFCLSGFVGIGIGDIALFQALPRLGPRLSMLLVQCLTAPFGALLEWIWLGTSLTAWQLAFGTLILAGVGVALAPAEHLHLNRRRLVSGFLFATFAALGGAGGAVLSRKAYEVTHVNHEHLDPGTAGFQRVLGGLFVAGLGLLAVKWLSLRSPALLQAASTGGSKWRRLWPWVLANSLAGQTLGVTAMQWALETTPTGIVLAIIALTPIVVIPFAFVIEHERPSPRSLLGGLVAVAGVIALTLNH